VQAEAERLQYGDQTPSPEAPEPPSATDSPTESPQQQIDRLRAKVADLNIRLDGTR